LEQVRSVAQTGGMISRLYQGQEQQQLYIFELKDEIRRLNEELGRPAVKGNPSLG
jgi:hypothetical protein